MLNRQSILAALAILLCSVSLGHSQQIFGRSAQDDAGRQARLDRFEKTMTGAVLVGQFTIIGKPAEKPANEEYTIKSVKKLPTGDYWLFQARIKYMDKDLTLPIPIEVKWAGDTPVITLSDTTIPGLGTFGARVVIDGGKYAGTWSHDDAGGHMFGVIQREQSTAAEGSDE